MITSYATQDALADAAAQQIHDVLSEALRRRGRASLVATGGRSPGPIYDRLRESGLDWPAVTVTLSDERCVEPDAPDSNLRQVRERLLQGPAARAQVVPLWPAPDAAALARLLPFDAVMLGMGEDGHIASLIPGDPGLEAGLTTAEVIRPVPAGLGKPPLARITLTLSALLGARAIFLSIAGDAKRDVLNRALAGEDLPVGRLISQAREPIRVLWAPSHES